MFSDSILPPTVLPLQLTEAVLGRFSDTKSHLFSTLEIGSFINSSILVKCGCK